MPLVRKTRTPNRKRVLLSPPLERQAERVVVEFMRENVLPKFEEIVEDWKSENQPKFWVRREISAAEIRTWIQPVGPNKKVMQWLDKGTKPHIIRPKRAARLSFKWGGPGSYRPKTRPANAPLRLSGGQQTRTVFAKEVKHPGTEPRLFGETIEKEVAPEFRRLMENAFRRWARLMNRSTP